MKTFVATNATTVAVPMYFATRAYIRRRIAIQDRIAASLNGALICMVLGFPLVNAVPGNYIGDFIGRNTGVWHVEDVVGLSLMTLGTGFVILHVMRACNELTARTARNVNILLNTVIGAILGIWGFGHLPGAGGSAMLSSYDGPAHDAMRSGTLIWAIVSIVFMIAFFYIGHRTFILKQHFAKGTSARQICNRYITLGVAGGIASFVRIIECVLVPHYNQVVTHIANGAAGVAICFLAAAGVANIRHLKESAAHLGR